MTTPNERPTGREDLASPERREVLRTASRLVAGAAFAGTLADAASAQPAASGAPLAIPGFAAERIPTSGGVTINAAKAGRGPPLLLLHGAPQSLYTWRDVAPRLAETYTVVVADLRGYGDSGKPQGLPDHANYSKRAMAQDQVDVMQHFGFERFAVVGQDRGGRVTHRMALDHPDKVTKAVLIDILPTHYLYTHVNLEFVQAYFHWFNWLRPAPGPENDLLAQNAQAGQVSPAQAEYRRTNGTPEGVHGMCEDYRAAASIDLTHDAADLDTKVRCPLNVLWAENAAMDRLYDVLAIWHERGTNVEGKGMPGGHNMQEGAPAELLVELTRFLRS